MPLPYKIFQTNIYILNLNNFCVTFLWLGWCLAWHYSFVFSLDLAVCSYNFSKSPNKAKSFEMRHLDATLLKLFHFAAIHFQIFKALIYCMVLVLVLRANVVANITHVPYTVQRSIDLEFLATHQKQAQYSLSLCLHVHLLLKKISGSLAAKCSTTICSPSSCYLCVLFG